MVVLMGIQLSLPLIQEPDLRAVEAGRGRCGQLQKGTENLPDRAWQRLTENRGDKPHWEYI